MSAFKRNPGLLPLLYLLAASLGGSIAIAAAPIALVEGQNFRTLAAREPTTTGDKIEILEFFSYGCVHCFDFEQPLRAWKASLPDDVAVIVMPATFNPNFAMYARGYYAAEALGLAAATHELVFDTIWKKKLAPRDFNELAGLYLTLGVDRDKFIAAAKSPEVEAKLREATAKSERLQLEGTPTVYVDGKYQMLTTGAQNFGEVMGRIDALIARVRAERATAQPKAQPAPSRKSR